MIRKRKGLSQEELAFQLGISQRHVSFVESGRAKPSRDLLLDWLHTLETELVFCNEILIETGYAPAYSERSLSDPELQQTNQALSQLLAAHDPMPAMVLDAFWNIHQLNQGAAWLAAQLMPDLVAEVGPGPLNMLDLLVHPNGFLSALLNLEEVGPILFAHLKAEARALPQMQKRVDQVSHVLIQKLGEAAASRIQVQPKSPVLTSRFQSPWGPLSFFSMFTTFGSPQDISLESLRVEHMFAADESTRKVLTQQVHRTQ